ncbi:MAG: CdaR family protein [Ignavibacteria bacterium]|nr:CdaR family protein [Ignavibacteria bacterium]
MKIERKSINDKLKGIIFALLVSFSIWFYSILNSEYSITIKVPLTINTPERFSISGRIPEKIDVLISAIGWQILNLTFLPKSSFCNISVDISERTSDQLIITKNDIIRNIHLGVNAKILDVNPGTLMIEVGKMFEKVVPVEPNITIHPRENFVVVGKPIVKPEFITIKGRKEIIEKIESWKTAKVILDDVNKPIQVEVPLSDTLHSQISFNVSKVMVYVDIDFAVDKTIYDIPVRIEGGSLPEGHIIEPKYVTATIRSGVNKMIESDLVFLDAKIDYNQIMNDTIGILIPHIDLPNSFTITSLDPPYIIHRRVTKVK